MTSPGPVLLARQSAAIGEPFARTADGRPHLPIEAVELYRFGRLIRSAETLLLDLFTRGLLSGTTHTCLGQELCSMSVARALGDPDDAIFSNHRNHGHFLTYSGEFVGLVAEIMGREGGVCRGVGGSQHLAWRNFHSNGVQAGMTAIGVGQALARARRGTSGIVGIFVGDGTLGEGLLYESLNLASIWTVPALFVVEDNGIAQTTPTAETIGGSIERRGAAFGLETWRLRDVQPDFFERVESSVEWVRRRRRPGYLVIETRRLGPHSKGDDLRPQAVIEAIRDRDPLAALGRSLPPAMREGIDRECARFIDGVRARAEASPPSRYARRPPHVFLQAEPRPMPAASGRGHVRLDLNRALARLLAERPEIIVLGEDLHEPYGGAFKVTAGLSREYRDRVISTPISEAGIVGAGIGLALAGMRPVVEIMFADFVTLAMDQLVNHAAKFPGMFPDARVPLVVRAPSGGRRGYGPTHSQSPENLLAAVPGLTVVFPTHRHGAGELLRRAVLDWPYPTVFVEHKLLYGLESAPAGYREVPARRDDPGAWLFPTLRAGDGRPDIAIVAIGHMLAVAEEAAQRLREEELDVEIVTPSLLAPFPEATLWEALRDCDRVVVAEEATMPHGFGAELAACLLTRGWRGHLKRVATSPVPLPAARSLEAQIMPASEQILQAVMELVVS